MDHRDSNQCHSRVNCVFLLTNHNITPINLSIGWVKVYKHSCQCSIPVAERRFFKKGGAEKKKKKGEVALRLGRSLPPISPQKIIYSLSLSKCLCCRRITNGWYRESACIGRNKKKSITNFKGHPLE